MLAAVNLPPHESVTQTQIAEALGLSQVTVHRALSGHARVTPETKARILKAAAQMGYRTNFFASQLRSKQRKIIILGVTHLQDPYCIGITEAFERASAQRGYHIMLSHLYDGTNLDSLQRDILGPNGVNNLALVGSSVRRIPDETITALINSGVNVVLLGRMSKYSQVPQIGTDNTIGGHLVANHFFAAGIRKSWLVTLNLSKGGIYERGQAYMRRLRELGLPAPRVFKVPASNNTIEERLDASREILTKAFEKYPLPEAIFAAGTPYAVEVLRAAHERGYQAGKDFRLIAYDDDWPTRYFFPTLSTVRQPTTEIGRAGADYLIDVIEGKRRPGGNLIFEPSLVIRTT